MYQVVNEDGVFHVRKGIEPIFTPAGNPVITKNEALAARLAEHFEKYGEDPENRCSIAMFHFPRLDFVRLYPRLSIEQQLILGFDPYNDWTLRCKAEPGILTQRWLDVFGEPHTRRQEGKNWVEALNQSQLCAALVLGKAMGSMNIAYLAAHCQSPEEISRLLKEISLFNHSLVNDSLEALFANFLFYWET